MNYKKISVLFLVFGLLLHFSTNSSACDKHAATKSSPRTDFLYQYSIIDALLAGVFDGDLTFGELKKHGDFGIGTFNQLDGELIMLDGIVYKIRHDGKVLVVPDHEKTPLAFVNFFKADTTFTIVKADMTFEDVEAYIDSLFNRNYLYAVQIKGEFKTISARSVRPATPPYPSLTEHIQNGGQQLFNFSNVKGVCAGYSLPPYMARTNVPGYHVHFLSEDKTQGGHVFGFTADTLEIQLNYIHGFTVESSAHEEFKNIDLYKDRAKELHSVEK